MSDLNLNIFKAVWTRQPLGSKTQLVLKKSIKSPSEKYISIVTDNEDLLLKTQWKDKKKSLTCFHAHIHGLKCHNFVKMFVVIKWFEKTNKKKHFF